MEPKETLGGLGSGKEKYAKWKDWFKVLVATAGAELKKTQSRYKRDFDRRLRIPRPEIRTGAQLFGRKDYTNPPTETRHKLAPVSTGSYMVLEALDDIVVIRTPKGAK